MPILPVEKDPMGNAVIDYLKGRKDADIIVYSDVAEDDVIPVRYLFRTYDQMPELETIAIEYCRGRILDIGAGVGCHALMLQSLNIEVTAVDISKRMVRVMKKRGVKDARCIDFFDLEGEQYDTLLMLMNGIGIAGTMDGLDSLLKHARGLLKPGGQILLESADVAYMFKEKDGSLILNLNNHYYGEVTYQMKYGEIIGDHFDWLYISMDLLEQSAVQHGYEFDLLYEGDMDNYLASLTLK